MEVAGTGFGKNLLGKVLKPKKIKDFLGTKTQEEFLVSQGLLAPREYNGFSMASGKSGFGRGASLPKELDFVYETGAGSWKSGGGFLG